MPKPDEWGTAVQDKPLRIALVVPQDGAQLQDWQALLIDRIRKDDRFKVIGRIIGAQNRQDPAGSFLTLLLKRAERIMAAHRILAYDTQPATNYLGSLPITEDRAELALAMGPVSLTDFQLAQMVLGEWSMTYGGMADPFNATLVSEATSAARIEVQIFVPVL